MAKSKVGKTVENLGDYLREQRVSAQLSLRQLAEQTGAHGEAVVGPRKGATLAEIPSQQVTLETWLAMHPRSLVMQPDSAFLDRYPEDADYETGASRRALQRILGQFPRMGEAGRLARQIAGAHAAASSHSSLATTAAARPARWTWN